DGARRGGPRCCRATRRTAPEERSLARARSSRPLARSSMPRGCDRALRTTNAARRNGYRAAPSLVFAIRTWLLLSVQVTAALERATRGRRWGSSRDRLLRIHIDRETSPPRGRQPAPPSDRS